jgi:hypothetical protein
LKVATPFTLQNVQHRGENFTTSQKKGEIFIEPFMQKAM